MSNDYIDWEHALPICQKCNYFEKGAPPGHRDHYSDTCRRYGGKLTCTINKAIILCDKHPIYVEIDNRLCEIPLKSAKELLKIINSEINNFIDDPRMSGKAPDIYYELKKVLEGVCV